jgi:uncharacterized membrane protein
MPNWHPMIVHFPIALLTLSVVVDLGALLTGHRGWHRMAYALVIAGTLGAAAAVISGNDAAVPHRDSSLAEVVAEHEDFATAVLITFLATSLGRLPLFLRSRHGWPLNLWIVLAFLGCGLLWLTSLHGGELVYEHGIGVQVQGLGES